ncbi:hypothetical protein KPL37_08950 [Clostridium frigoris]|uniref:Uncharacterized protein n=1 Tax=Clostridium frigoris TaxID=205327 RepID=A0ABS6BSH1_9CLOT|nr:hypothetical protein [Clostridium frigoris]MBU3159878.1 hypothetical protein [Clostridium frigoris]
MTKAANAKDTEMLLQTIAYLESVIVPSRDLAFIYCAVCYLRKAIDEGGVADD